MNAACEGWLSVNQFNDPHEVCSPLCVFSWLELFTCPVSGACVGAGWLPAGRIKIKNACRGKPHARFVDCKVAACLGSGNIHRCGVACDHKAEDDEAQTFCRLTKVVLSSSLEATYEGWFKANVSKFASTLVHECSVNCSFVPLPVFKCPDFGTCVGGGIFPVVGPKRTVHSARNKCFGKPHTFYPAARLFGCLSTGRPHYCGKKCDRVIETYEGYSVCDFTGRVLTDILIARKQPLPAGCVFRETSDFKSEYVRAEAATLDLARYHAHVSAGLKRKDSTLIREEVYNSCYALSIQYMSKRISVTNVTRNKDCDLRVKEALDTYHAKRSRSSVLAMVQIAAAIRSQQPLTVNLAISAEKIRRHACTLATRIVALMGMVRHFTAEGKLFIDGLSLKSFFLMALELCRQGITVDHCTLLSPDPILMLIAKGDTDMASFWQEHIDKRRIRKNLSRLPGQLRDLISRAITVDRVNPEQLRIDEVQSYLHVSTDYFEGYRNNKT